MDHSFSLNTTNLPQTFTNEVQSAKETYFASERELSSSESDTSQSDSDESESSEEQENSTELDRDIEWRECDIQERQKVRSFLEKGCGCSLQSSDKENCSKRYSVEKVLEHRQICLDMSSSELDMVILAQFNACSRRDEMSSSGRQKRKRQRVRTKFIYEGKYWPCNRYFSLFLLLSVFS